LDTDFCGPSAGSGAETGSGNGNDGSTNNTGSGSDTDDGCSDCSGSSTGTGGTGDTGDDAVTAPINDSPEYLRKKDFLRNHLTVEQKDWFNAQVDPLQNSIINYLENEVHSDVDNNSYGDEAIDFAEAAINEAMDGAELDMVNEIIKDSSFVNSKADCVYELLKSTGNNLFKDLMSDFTNNKSKSKLKFQIGTVPDGADGLTTYDPDTGIITITFPPAVNTLTSLEVAALILHEGLHAELRRIYIGNNQVPEPLPQAQFDYLISYYEYYKGIVAANNVSNFASHTYMVYNHLEPLARAVRELDDYHYDLNHYMWYAWDGLSNIGKNAIPQLLTNAQEDNFQNLQQITINDDKKQNCDE
jgi:hypothetical protein